MLDRLKRHIIPLLALLAATFAVYWQTLGHEFLLTWDDQKYVTDNVAVRGFTWAHLKTAFTAFYVGNYAPLQIVSYMADYTLWGLRPSGFILTNIVLHALNGLLYYLLVLRLGGRRIWAFFASFIFLLHPVQVESVAWISQRKNLLALLFFLISFLLYTAYRQAGTGEVTTSNSQLETQNPKLLYVGSIAAFLCALLAKSAAVVLPPLLLLYDHCFVPKERRRRWLADKTPYVLAAGGVAVLAWISQQEELGGGRRGYHGGGPFGTFCTMLPVFVRYLGMLAWPTNLSAIYTPPVKSGADGGVALAALLLALAAAGLFLLYRRRRDLFFWGAAFWVGLAPVAQIVPLVTLMNDRYLYFPMLGGAALVAGGGMAAVERVAVPYRRWLGGALSLVLLVLPLLSFQRSRIWHDSLTLWSDTVAKAPTSPLTNFSLASTHQMNGRPDDAIPYYRRALELDPADRDTLINLSNLYLDKGEPDAALPYIRRLVEDHPNFTGGFLARAHYCFLTGNLPGAEADCLRAVQLEPGNGLALRYLGVTYRLEGKIGPAREAVLRALAAGGESPELRFELARLDAAAGDNGAALAHLESAFRLGFRDRRTLDACRELDLVRGTPECRRLLETYLQQ
ncbi:MAG TPA: tetratricopeptide repeat protein [Geobacteraceae bacterium]|nr:tetratricopeptide repeat protein [Geobacteraceae bacterium]